MAILDQVNAKPIENRFPLCLDKRLRSGLNKSAPSSEASEPPVSCRAWSFRFVSHINVPPFSRGGAFREGMLAAR
mgnify:CR=1 FL=1